MDFLSPPAAQKIPQLVLAGSLTTGWLGLSTLLHQPLLIQILPAMLMFTVAFGYIGLHLLRSLTIARTGRLVLGSAFLLSSTSSLLTLLWLNQPQRIWVENLSWFIAPLIALGLLMVFTERQQAQQRQAQLAYQHQLEQDLQQKQQDYQTLIEQQGVGVSIVAFDETILFANPAAEQIFGVPSGTLAGRNLAEFTSPEQFTTLTSQTALRQTGLSNSYEIIITRPDGELRHVLISATPRRNLNGEFDSTIGVFQDITEPKQTEARIQQLLNTERIYRQQAETLRDATTALVSALDLNEVLQRVFTYLRLVIPYTSVCVFLFEDQCLRAVAGSGFNHPERVIGQNIDLHNPLIAEALTIKRPIILADVQNDPRFARWGDSQHTRAWMCVPLIWHNDIIGFLTIDHNDPNTYTEAQGDLAQAFANQAALAIQNSRMFAHIEHLAITDPLTNLYNRRHLFDLARREFNRYQRYHNDLAIIMCDIDHFTHVNNTYGHAIGDIVLQTITRRMTQNLRETDILGRYGGEEFMLVLTETSLQQAAEAAERLRSCVAKPPIPIEGHQISVTLSIGVACATPHCLDLDTLIRHADQALYQAKANGRNQVVCWQDVETNLTT
jgi:diguanylate cyclase (GGDEF)-like protein/PAS domain S-box-containing protein